MVLLQKEKGVEKVRDFIKRIKNTTGLCGKTDVNELNDGNLY